MVAISLTHQYTNYSLIAAAQFIYLCPVGYRPANEGNLDDPGSVPLNGKVYFVSYYFLWIHR